MEVALKCSAFMEDARSVSSSELWILLQFLSATQKSLGQNTLGIRDFSFLHQLRLFSTKDSQDSSGNGGPSQPFSRSWIKSQMCTSLPKQLLPWGTSTFRSTFFSSTGDSHVRGQNYTMDLNAGKGTSWPRTGLGRCWVYAGWCKELTFYV